MALNSGSAPLEVGPPGYTPKQWAQGPILLDVMGVLGVSPRLDSRKDYVLLGPEGP